MTIEHTSARSDDEFLMLLEPQLAKIQRIALLLCGDRHDADDVVADAVARTLPRWRSGDVADVGAYVRRVAVNLVTDRKSVV